MIVVDTSAWIDFFAGKKTTQTTRLKNAIQNAEDLCICGVILTEVLQGIRKDSDFERIAALFYELVYLPEQKSTHLLAAKIYRSLRKKGITIRKPIDCIIAANCIENTSFILHNDKDFEYISRHFPLQSV